ncbi:hypothetical protein [Fodinicola acaciae]|uniref:hypothetical protein n=1 Tax=Fodinicola acaciae TaxID=2681555 RepID=UPI0013D21E72|nr:hypothetical protein [Fodinicola acaciae]
MNRRAFFVAVAVMSVLAPWCVVLAHTLPATATVPNWSLAWVGLDCGEALAAGLTALLILRRDPRSALTSTVGGALLLADAWFDVTTSIGGDYVQAVVMAVLLEIPLATLAFWYASSVLLRPEPEFRSDWTRRHESQPNPPALRPLDRTEWSQSRH